MPNFDDMMRGFHVIVSPELNKLLGKECGKEGGQPSPTKHVNRVYPGIKAVYPNPSKGVVAVKFMDGEVRVATCDKEDNFDVNVGVAICIATYLYGSKKNFRKIVEKKTK